MEPGDQRGDGADCKTLSLPGDPRVSSGLLRKPESSYTD